MPQQPLHIVSFDNPFPPMYGGAIEVFYKLQPLRKLGIAVHLHCFVAEVPIDDLFLRECVTEIYYYKNPKNWRDLFSRLPFSVKSRTDKQLTANLLKVNAPVLFEGLKTTHPVFTNSLPGVRTVMRLHNVEHMYFDGLGSSESNLFQKWAFLWEAYKFRGYEKIMSKFDRVVALSKFEAEYVTRHFLAADYVPVFHGNKSVAALDGLGNFALYHGDLKMSDNRRVAKNLIKLFRQIPDFELVIASGAKSRDYFVGQIGNQKNVRYEVIDTFEDLKLLLAKAQLNLIFSYQRSGTKLKLMNALYHGRFCVINENIMDDPDVVNLCEFATSDREIIEKVNLLKSVPYTDYERRRQVLESKMNDETNAKHLLDIIFPSL